ncbi:methyltransferase family protein [Neolewinella xylanilytica]|uniref:Methyltransferase family protein n=1 Tax=Neolewinella xylanilytica TaxID=1514080 RepID=A0A2S6I7A5_9BACT|nr:class I SAM-dependent methyltransferase [Neolewinella xylanilytica]PPK87370.1 methyltransferase family protein [Neolewinella xylanilytica]
MEFWEASFRDKQEMWGQAPADAARQAADFFQQQGLGHVLIPGFGYGRNARPFTAAGMRVTGIEIAATAIELARRHLPPEVVIHHGSVGDMPFDEALYDGIFCYALIHLLDPAGRRKLIEDCYRHLAPGGYMIFVALSTENATYGEGEAIGDNSFVSRHGVSLFFYDDRAVESEFGDYGLIEAEEVTEPTRAEGEQPVQKFWRIVCEKEEVE